MLRQRLITFFILTIIYRGAFASILDWVWHKNTDDTTVLVADGVPLVSIPYESMTEDEKFLQEAAKFTEIQVSSPLESCQHRVIMKIKTSCSEMSEEQLAKLSVNLLNCQSAVEGRKMFPCTDEMSLKQCTTDMDPDMWNAYHLMSNRARAVCYAARSTQFRALTELTVNKLMQTAHNQIKTLYSLKEGQDRLGEQTIEALSSLSKGNEALLEQQKHLKNAQTLAHNLVASNLRELNNEKALIRLGHTQLAAMTDEIRKKLEEANKYLEEQVVERSENHKEILEDLANIQDQAQLIWNKIESSTNRIFEQHEKTIIQYERTLEKLGQINDTIHYIWNITNSMREEIDEKLNWLTDYIGDTGEQMHRIYHVGMHFIYLLSAMIISAFLNAPLLTRLTILGIVPLNLLSYLKHGMDASLDFVSMSVLIFLITMMHFIMIGIQRLFGPKKTRAEPVQFIEKNGYAKNNGRCVSQDKLSFFAKLKRDVQAFYNSAFYQINYGFQKFNSLIQTVVSWSKQGLSQHEELSCSYVSSKKARKDMVREYEDYQSILSDDITDFERSDNETYNNVVESNNFIDGIELRQRLRNMEGSIGRSSYPRHWSPSRSVTPSSLNPRMLCNATTKSGRRCRLMASNGNSFCGKHSPGTSVMGD